MVIPLADSNGFSGFFCRHFPHRQSNGQTYCVAVGPIARGAIGESLII